MRFLSLDPFLYKLSFLSAAQVQSKNKEAANIFFLLCELFLFVGASCLAYRCIGTYMLQVHQASLVKYSDMSIQERSFVLAAYGSAVICPDLSCAVCRLVVCVPFCCSVSGVLCAGSDRHCTTSFSCLSLHCTRSKCSAVTTHLFFVLSSCDHAVFVFLHVAFLVYLLYLHFLFCELMFSQSR